MTPDPEMIECDFCLGEGKLPVVRDIAPAALPPEEEFDICPKCNGTGKILAG